MAQTLDALWSEAEGLGIELRIVHDVSDKIRTSADHANAIDFIKAKIASNRRLRQERELLVAREAVALLREAEAGGFYQANFRSRIRDLLASIDGPAQGMEAQEAHRFVCPNCTHVCDNGAHDHGITCNGDAKAHNFDRYGGCFTSPHP